LQNEVLNEVRYGSNVYTDSAVGYDKLHFRFVHDVVNEAETYVKGRVHTNGLENFLVSAQAESGGHICSSRTILPLAATLKSRSFGSTIASILRILNVSARL